MYFRGVLGGVRGCLGIFWEGFGGYLEVFLGGFGRVLEEFVDDVWGNMLGHVWEVVESILNCF